MHVTWLHSFQSHVYRALKLLHLSCCKTHAKVIRNVYKSHLRLECEPPVHSVLIVYTDGSERYIGKMTADVIFDKYPRFLSEGHWRFLDDEDYVPPLFDDVPVKLRIFNEIPSPDPGYS